jgi:uncharacterized membrane protein YkoI
MGEHDEKAVVKIDADGSVLRCAKGLAVGECGFVPGAKVCGKCGAMPVQMKAMHEMGDGEDLESQETEDDEETEEKPEKMMGYGKKKKPLMYKASDDEEMGDEDDEDDEDDEGDTEQTPTRVAMPEADDEDDEDADADEDDEDADADADADEDEDETPPSNEMEQMRARRLATMGMKSADVGTKGYMCAIDRKVYPGGVSVCDDCPGGCVSEKGMPGILHVEGLAEEMFDGKVLDSGYSAEADMFVVDVQAKDGRAVEVFVDGTNGEVLGWHKLDNETFEQKSLVDEMMLIDFTEAAEIATKSVEGTVVCVEPDVFEGFDAYAVEIDGIDGKSYDVFVALDGEVLGFDKYEEEEAADIEAEAAEIAMKRAFAPEQRERMAKEGTALPDGSFPIASREDLANAIQAYGRAKDKNAAKAHIVKRAKALGAESMIPEHWGASKSETQTSADDSFMASLMEFELLNAEIDESNTPRVD